MELQKTGIVDEGWMKFEKWSVLNEEQEIMSKAYIKTIQTRYADKWLTAMAIGGVGTGAQFRRKGCVRVVFEEIFRAAPERGWEVAMLHPFSYPYYRMFGFERVCDHLVIDLPMHTLGFLPRPDGFVLLNNLTRLEDALDLFERFTVMRNVSFRRKNAERYSLEPTKDNRYTFLDYENGKAQAYVTVCHDDRRLIVDEIAFTSPKALVRAMGFLRMYEGEADTLRFPNCAMMPEVDMLLRSYKETQYTLIPDIMVRILDVPAVLRANVYPERAGHFTLKVNDPLPYTNGVYSVEYQHGKAEVKKLAPDAKADIAVSPPALAQLLYGYDHYTAGKILYMQGAECMNDAEDFFRAFPKRSNGMFEHF